MSEAVFNQGLKAGRSRSDYDPSGKEGMWLFHPVASTSSPCSLSCSLSLPSLQAWSTFWKIKCVTLDVISCLLLAGLSTCFPALVFVSFFTFFPSLLSLFTSGLNYSTSVHLWFVLSEINEALGRTALFWRPARRILHPNLRPFVPSSQHCLHFIKHGLDTTPLNIRQKHMCGCVFMSSYMMH